MFRTCIRIARPLRIRQQNPPRVSSGERSSSVGFERVAQRGDVPRGQAAAAAENLHAVGDPAPRELCQGCGLDDVLELPVGHAEVAGVRVSHQGPVELLPHHRGRIRHDVARRVHQPRGPHLGAIQHGDQLAERNVPIAAEAEIEPAAAVSFTRSWLWTDSPLVRPGGKVHIAGTLRRFADRAWDVGADAERVLEILDPHGEVIERHPLQADANGLITSVWQVPDDGEPGDYRLRFAGDSGYRDACWVTVSDETLPELAIVGWLRHDRRHHSHRGAYRQAAIPLSGRVVRWNRQPVHGARVHLQLAIGEAVHEVHLATDADGAFEHDWTLPAHAGDRLQVTTTATHRLGQAHPRRSSLTWHDTPWQIDIRGHRNPTLGSAYTLDLDLDQRINTRSDGVTVRVPALDHETRTDQHGRVSIPCPTDQLDANAYEVVCTRGDLEQRTHITITTRPPREQQMEDREASLGREQFAAALAEDGAGAAADADGAEIMALPTIERIDEWRPLPPRLLLSTTYRASYVGRELPLDIEVVNGENPEVVVDRALVTVANREVLHREWVALGRHQTRLSLPVTEAWLPNVTVTVDSYSGGAHVRARKRLTIHRPEEHLRVRIDRPSRALRPGSTPELTVSVRDRLGRPVTDARLTVAVHDVAVREIATPSSTFTHLVAPGRWQAASLAHGYDRPAPSNRSAVWFRAGQACWWFVEREKPSELSSMGSGGGSRRAGAGRGTQPLRRDFAPAPFWTADLRTDDTGETTVRIRLGDQLTTWHIQAVAVGRSGIGQTQIELPVQDAVLATVATPRVLRVGDRCRLPVTLDVRDAPPEPLQCRVSASWQGHSAGERSARWTPETRDDFALALDLQPHTADTYTVRTSVGPAART